MRWYVFVLLLLSLIPDAGAAEPKLCGEVMTTIRNGKTQKLAAVDFPVIAVQGAKMKLGAVPAEEGRALDLTPGLYLFGPKGAVMGRIDMEEPRACESAFLSPDGKTLAVDSGIGSFRELTFYALPRLRQMGSPIPYGVREGSKGPVWADKDTLVYVFLDADTNRTCQYDPCAVSSVRSYTVSTGTEHTLLQGTDLCDYGINTVKGANVEAFGVCKPSVRDWDQWPGNTDAKPVGARLH